ncbi:MAG: hypothetical protein KF724_11680 [Phycisphaeraceae bacterium]|nr:hypothetical protein [Phycisphaeraceae bacterium]
MPVEASSIDRLAWWQDLRHEGLLLDMQRLRDLVAEDPEPLPSFREQELRRAVTTRQDGGEASTGEFVALVLEKVCGFAGGDGSWQRGSSVPAEWSRLGSAGETIRPRHLWSGPRGAVLPVFFEPGARVGIGRGRRTVSQVLQWLRAGGERLAILTNGEQWRLIFAGIDFHASVEWDVESWFEEGGVSRRLTGLRSLLNPTIWTPPERDQPSPLLRAILDSRKGQSDLSAILGERVRRAVEILAQAHEQALHERAGAIDQSDLYRAAVRMIMRIVVTLFAESRELLPADNEIYHTAYSVRGLRDRLEREFVRSPARLARCHSGWPHLLALFRLIHDGCAHEALPVPRYGGELFEPGDPASADGVSRAVHLFETDCFDAEVIPDRDVHAILDLLTRTKVRIRQGRSSTLVAAPVNFSELDNEYIGILYEGLLDYELRAAPGDQPVIFLNVGDQPALPLATLEAMDDAALKALLEKMKQKKQAGSEDEEEGDDAAEEADDDDGAEADSEDSDPESDSAAEEEQPEVADDAEASEGIRHTTRSRAEQWARRACEVAGIVPKPRGRLTPERQLQHEAALARAARALVDRVILPREWYLVRWGGTRKGSGTFYTKPQLAIPTVHRTLRPLAFDPPTGADGLPDTDAAPHRWVPKRPEEILSLKVCDPACGSGSFPLAALRFLTDALFQSILHHRRLEGDIGRPLRDILGLPAPHAANNGAEPLREEKLPCRPEDDRFEERLKAVLRRHVVERCIYGVDLDPLAAELCRLALWIETMDRDLPFSFLDHKVRCGNSLVGAWFDQFLHYPVMAWEREGGDKSHANGVHFAKEAFTKAIATRKSKVVKPDLIAFIDSADMLFKPDLAAVATAHDEAERALRALHELPVHETAERSRRFRALRETQAFTRLKDALDLWCAIWFWPGDRIDDCPLPTEFAAPTEDARTIARELAGSLRFFHWELEFPDVFRAGCGGFDAVVGNPPWENLQPNSEEYFSNVNPLFRSFIRVDKLRWQSSLFAKSEDQERRWLLYQASFKDFSNWVRSVGHPFGNRIAVDSNGHSTHDVNLGDRGRSSFASSNARHELWKQQRERAIGYADSEHPFEYQVGRIFTYKLFLEHSRSLLREHGRLGLIVPSGLYSDAWSQPLRDLLLARCRWEWLFGFENRDKVFDIDSRFKFNPVIIAKGGETSAIRTAFMRRDINDWEVAESLAVLYPKSRIEAFSPATRTLLEIREARDLQLVERIYSSCMHLGNRSGDGWAIEMHLEYMMNTDAKLFPPTDRWERDGFVPDEYSRWVRGGWRDRTRDCPVPPGSHRADGPPGVILSRDGLRWIEERAIERETVVETDADGQEIEVTYPSIALPVYTGALFWLNDWAYSGDTNRASESRELTPRYLLPVKLRRLRGAGASRIVFRDISNATNERSFVAALIPDSPCGNKAPVMLVGAGGVGGRLDLITQVTSLVFDWATRVRMAATQLNFHIVQALPVLSPGRISARGLVLAARLNLTGARMSPELLLHEDRGLHPGQFAYSAHERVRIRSILDAVVAQEFGLALSDLEFVLRGCDQPLGARGGGDPKGFWRVDKDKHPEHRHTVLTLIAFHDLMNHIDACGGDRDKGIESFLNQNDGEGWMLPETLRLAEYGLGHDERAKEHQPVRSYFGPRFYDWQLAQTAEESWRECHLHARNLLGEEGYQRLLSEISGDDSEHVRSDATAATARSARRVPDEDGDAPLFQMKES